MSFWPNDSGRFNVLHLDDGHPLQVMGEDLQTFSNVPQTAEQHSGQLSQVFTYGGTPGSCGNKRKGGAIAKIIHAEMTQKNEKGPHLSKSLGRHALTLVKIQLMLAMFSPKQGIPSMIPLWSW